MQFIFQKNENIWTDQCEGKLKRLISLLQFKKENMPIQHNETYIFFINKGSAFWKLKKSYLTFKYTIF